MFNQDLEHFLFCLFVIWFLLQDEEDEKAKKPKTIDAKEVQKVKEKKKKELEDVSESKCGLTKYFLKLVSFRR